MHRQWHADAILYALKTPDCLLRVSEAVVFGLKLDSATVLHTALNRKHHSTLSRTARLHLELSLFFFQLTADYLLPQPSFGIW